MIKITGDMRVCYGLVGMTRGHAARALALGQELIDRGHDVLFFTEGQAEELLLARFGKDRVVHTTSLRYHFSKGKISLPKTFLKNLKFLFRRKKYTRPLVKKLKEWDPDISIADYEPFMWQASKQLKIPHVALNSQEFFNSSKMPKKLPYSLRIKAFFAGRIVRWLSPTADLRIVAKHLVGKKPKSNVINVGGVLRKEFDEIQWNPKGKYFLVYLPDECRFALDDINKLAKRMKLRGEVYGLENKYLLEFDDLGYNVTSETGFMEAMSGAEFIISTPGNQLPAEATFLGIPMLLVSWPNHFEGEINARIFLEAMPENYALFGEQVNIPKNSKSIRKKGVRNGREIAIDAIEDLYSKIK